MSIEFHSLLVNDDSNTLEVVELSEFIKDSFYFMTLTNCKDSTTLQSFVDWKKSLNDNNVFYLNIDNCLIYEGFYNDFGPLNLGKIYHYINIVRDKFKAYKRVVHCTHNVNEKNRTNAAFLICAYMIIENNWTAHQTYTILSQQYKYQYLPFRDASCLVKITYLVTVEDCVNALYKAKWYGFFDFGDFDVKEYEKFESIQFGDMNWIVPGTLLAFSSPYSEDNADLVVYQTHSPAYYYPYFKQNNVKHVVRLNGTMLYDAKRTFVDVANIKHTDMAFTDGTPPPDNILQLFLELCEQYIDDISEVENTCNFNISSEVSVPNCLGAVAVHCKAGLGRTGSLVASYIMKHWSFTAMEAIAWIRICRPGSVIGIQQQWLINYEEHLITIGKQWRDQKKHNFDKYRKFKNGVYSVKRYNSDGYAYEYVDSPPQSYFSNEKHFSSSSSGKNEIECVELEEYNQSGLSSVLKRKLNTNNHNVYSDVQSDIYVTNLKQTNPVSKNGDTKLDSTHSIMKNSCQVTNTSNEIIINQLLKNKIKIPNTITISRSNGKPSVVDKKNTKSKKFKKMVPDQQ